MTNDIELKSDETPEEYEEISCEEVDRVLESLGELMESVESENIKSCLGEAASQIYYLVYEDEDEAAADEAPSAEAA